MAKQTAQYKPIGFSVQGKALANADGTTVTSIATPSADDSVIKAILITSTDTSPRNVSLGMYIGSTFFVFDTLAVPAGAGTDGTTPAVDGLSSAAHALDAQGKKILPFPSTASLRAQMDGAITATKNVTITSILENF